jgi:RHS repeat-associated protein
VNLLTGDYQLSSTDVEEFGLALGRTSSSRDPRAGFEPQAEMLTTTQHDMSATTGVSGWAANIASVTVRGHSGMNSLHVVSTGASADSLAYLPALDLPRGSTYRITGWVYVPAATGLSPDSAAGLRLRAYWSGAGGEDVSAVSTKPTLTDSWQQVSMDVTVPASASTGAKIQLFNGFAAAGKAVFFDDVSVRQIWAPLGPQWSLGTADEAAGTAYTAITEPEAGVATLHLSDGGEVWFTAAGDGRWWPQPGAESLTLTHPALGQWRLTDLDGTVSTFATASTGVLEPGQRLVSGQSLFSSSGNFRLAMQTDGNLVLYSLSGQVLSATYTSVAGSTLDMQADGNLVLHSPSGAAVWHTSSWGNPGSRLVVQNDGNLVVYRPDNSYTWTSGTRGDYPAEDNAKLLTTSPPAAAGQTRLLYDSVGGRLRLSRLIAPVEPGVDGWPTNTTACTTGTPAVGCEVMQLVYAGDSGAPGGPATASTFGSYADRLVEVRLWSTAPGATVTDAVSAARYAYDTDGRLREVWDPRISPALKTTYGYDADGRVTQLGTPGELPWRFRFGTGGSSATVGGTDVVDRSSGRLLSVSRASLQPGTLDQAGPDTTSTVVYAVPTTRSGGGPYDLNPAALATWAQTRGPTDATAVFGPEDVPSVTTATSSAPGAGGYKAATVHYLDASGREVNTATPPGPGAPAAGYIDTAEYDQYGNVTRSLDATNRLLALGLLPSAAADLAALNLTAADSATRALALSTISGYGPQGLDLTSSRGPLLRLAIGNNPSDVRLVHDLTRYAYDEGKPDGAAYHLVTTETEGVLVAGSSPEQLLDVTVSSNRYNPIDGASPLGPTSGWVHKQATEVVVDAGAGGGNVTARVLYDAQGRAIESRKAGSTGSDAGTTRTVFYSAAANPTFPDCGSKPGTAGLACRTYSAGPAAGSNTAIMATQLPVKTVAYNRYGSITSVTESATGPVNGATVTQSRTTTTTYDTADRVVSVAITGTGAGGAALGVTTSTYDPASGDVIKMSTTNPTTGAVTEVKKTFDKLGRMTRYVDAAGGTTDSVFDRYGKPVTVTDSLGTTTAFTYDRMIEPRGFVTSVQDSVAGSIAATYGPDGQVLSQVLPGGVRLDVAYDANQAPVTRTYKQASDGVVIASSSVVENGAGQWISMTTAASSKTYGYDRLGRLTDVRDTTTGAGVCTARRYAYNDRAERTSLRTAASATSTCADPGAASAAVVSYAYDTADRLVSESTNGAGAWVYDPLGRITTAPVRGSPGARVANSYYANDLIASQTIDGVARQSWSLDPLQRFSSFTSESWAVGGSGTAGWQQAVTKTNHYDSDSDSPAWIAEDASLPNEVTRYVDGLDGNLAMQTGKTGARVLQLVDLHGDVMTTLPIRDGQSTADWTALRHQAADEFGNATNLTTGTAVTSNGASPGKDKRYGWLGGKQRSADALAGVLLMGVRLYDPGTGRFWSTDPEPGGNATAYDYCSADPVNCTDLTGRFGFKSLLKKVAKVAEIASNIPGPIGAVSAGISAGAYAATGNKGKALMMGITAAAQMVGAGGVVKAGAAVARAAGKVAARAGQAVAKLGKSCNSFTPETGVLVVDGTTVAISDIEVGDLVAARDPVTGELTAQPVLNVVVGHGDKHLIRVVTVPAPESALVDDQVADDDPRADTWTATANHPIWVREQGWTEADDLAVGDLLEGATGELRVVQDVDDEGWLHDQTVYNLSVANVHTFVVGDTGDGTLVHNSSAACPINVDKQKRHIPGTLEAKRKPGGSMFFGEGSAMKAVQMAIRRGTPVKSRGGELERRVWEAGVSIGRGTSGQVRTTITVVRGKKGWHGWPGSR